MTGTFEDVRRFIQADDRYSEAYKKKIVGRLSSYAKKTNRTLSGICADMDIFEREFGKGRAEAIPVGYKTKEQANTAASEIRTALRAYIEKDIRITHGSDLIKINESDEWSLVRKTLEKLVPNPHDLISIDKLIKKCRIARQSPSEISHAFLMKCIQNALTAGEYKSIQKAWKIIEKNRDHIRETVNLPEGLPFPSLSKTRSVCLRRKLPPRLMEQWLSWVQIKKSPEHIGIVSRDGIGGVSKYTLSSYEEGLTYYYTSLVELEHISPTDNPDLFHIINERFIAEIIHKEASGEFPWNKLEVSSLNGNIVRTIQIASELGMDVANIRSKVRRYKIFRNVRSMSRRNRAWCQKLMADRSRIIALYTLPNSTFNIAKDLLNDYDKLNHHNQQRAVKAAIAACAFAILLSLPIRVRTLVELKHSGLDANIFAFHKGRDLIVNTTADMIKNGYTHERVPLTPKAGGNPKEIVKWFIEKVHPILISRHIDQRLVNPNLLFGGISKSRLRIAISDYAIRNGIDLTPHLFRHAIATLLANEPNADFALIGALLGDQADTISANYAFIDQAKLHMEGQDRLARAQSIALRRGF